MSCCCWWCCWFLRLLLLLLVLFLLLLVVDSPVDKVPLLLLAAVFTLPQASFAFWVNHDFYLPNPTSTMLYLHALPHGPSSQTQQGIPTVVTQGYLVATSIIMAWQLRCLFCVVVWRFCPRPIKATKVLESSCMSRTCKRQALLALSRGLCVFHPCYVPFPSQGYLRPFTEDRLCAKSGCLLTVGLS